MKILDVDEDAQVREIFYEMLTRFGYLCRTAAHGREALAILSEEEIPLIISDIRMPGMDGIALIREIKSKHPDAEVISITGYAGDYTFTDVIMAGASDFILKPFTENEVEAKLNRIIRERQLGSDLIATTNSLRELNEYLENIIRSSLDCIIVSDSTGCITRANNSFTRLIGMEEHEILSRHISVFAPAATGRYESITGEYVDIDRGFFDDLRELNQRLMQEGRISNWETYLMRRRTRKPTGYPRRRGLSPWSCAFTGRKRKRWKASGNSRR